MSIHTGANEECIYHGQAVLSQGRTQEKLTLCRECSVSMCNASVTQAMSTFAREAKNATWLVSWITATGFRIVVVQHERVESKKDELRGTFLTK